MRRTLAKLCVPAMAIVAAACSKGDSGPPGPPGPSGPALVTAEYLPLQNGTRYEFDNTLVGTVGVRVGEPNLLGVSPLYVLFFQLGPADVGTYITRDASGASFLRGSYSTGGDYQEVLDRDGIWLDASVQVGTVISDSRSYTGYEPYGGAQVSYTGSETVTTTIVARGSLTTPLGTFSDVIEVRMETTYSDTAGFSGTGTDVFWLARGVGPVKLDLEAVGTANLMAGTVGGQPIQAR